MRAHRTSAIALAASLLAACSEPATECQVGLASAGSYAAVFTPKGHAPACTATTPGVLQKGDLVGMELYHPASSDGASYDETRSSVALKADSLGRKLALRAGAVSSGEPYATATFASATPDPSAMCHLLELAPADERLGATAALAADEERYAWSSVAVFVTPSAQGTQLEADLRYSENGCAMDYHVVGVWPAVTCTTEDGTPNPDLCSPCPEPAKDRFVGSGIGPDTALACKAIFAPDDPYSETGTPCALNQDCAPGACVGGTCKARPPYWCVLPDAGPIPELDPEPVACR